MYDFWKSAEWEAIKTAAINAAGGKCEFCGRPAETAHHVKYPKKLGTEEPRELIATCWRCHGLLHGKRSQKPAPNEEACEFMDMLAMNLPMMMTSFLLPKIEMSSIRERILQEAIWDFAMWVAGENRRTNEDAGEFMDRLEGDMLTKAVEAGEIVNQRALDGNGIEWAPGTPLRRLF